MALKGITVLEFAGLAPGPYAGKVLRDLGARVIRIDKAGAPAVDVLAHGKESIIVNLKHEKGVDVIKRLSTKSDVLIEPFRKGVMEKLGLGPNVLHTHNPKLIYARMTGYGQSGELAEAAGHDINYLGYSGVLSHLGRKNENPYAPINLLADFAGGGLMCAMAIITALYNRTKTKKGVVLDCSMVEGAAYVGSWLWASKDIPGLWSNPERGNNLLDGGYAPYETYKTKDDKFVAVGALEPEFYMKLIETLGIESDGASKETLTNIFKTKTRDEWDAIFKNIDACVSPVLELNEVNKNPHNKERHSFIEIGNGKILPRLKWFDDLGSTSTNYAQPKFGEHTHTVLAEFGFSKEEIENLLKNNAVKDASKKSKL